MKDTPRAALEAVLDPEHANAVLDHRKAIRKPLTAYAAKLLAKEFKKCVDSNEAADTMILNGWQGFKAEWIEPRGNVVKLATRETAWDRSGREYLESLERLKAG